MIRLHRSFFGAPLAHRALHDVEDGRPENSRAAVQAALDHGYGIEIDLQLSRDGEAMVFHDYDLDRLTPQSGLALEQDAARLSQIPLKGGSDGIPTLSEILTLVAGRAPMLIELKDQHGQMGVTDGRLEKATARALQGYEGAVGLMSFNPNMVALLAELVPDVPRGLVTSPYREKNWPELGASVRERLRDIPDFDRVGASFISHQADDLLRPRVADLKTQGADVFCWTIRTAQQEALARQVADNVTFEGYLAEIPA